MQVHHWRALGALSTGLLGATSVVLLARQRTHEAYALALFLSLAGTVTAVISTLNAGPATRLPQQPPEPEQWM